MGMLPLGRFRNMIATHRDQMISDFDELIMAADLIASRPNYLLLDEEGFYHAQVSGTLEEVIFSMQKLLDKAIKIKEQKERI